VRVGAGPLPCLHLPTMVYGEYTHHSCVGYEAQEHKEALGGLGGAEILEVSYIIHT